ncbi:hypothetical protein BJY00DRAFT_289733 [Aspergillus carlsbadensis]|nr:hypothetical protein BJY00DRAFT_289733 [Aspergillus carlsbadensis]
MTQGIRHELQANLGSSGLNSGRIPLGINLSSSTEQFQDFITLLQLNEPNHFPIFKPTFTMESVKNAANYVTESIQSAGSTASKETNKNVAKDNDASLTSRATAAKDAVVDKKDEKSHDAKADVHKEAAKN